MAQRGKTSFPKKQKAIKSSSDGLIRLNKYIANAGICSRREADTFIEAGVVKVNGKVITEMGYKVNYLKLDDPNNQGDFLPELLKLKRANGFEKLEVIEMPANNFSVIFRKR